MAKADRRPSYLFPAPAGPLRSLLDFKASQNQAFSDEEAALDVMLALDRNDLRPIRYLQARWGWTRYKVHSSLDALKTQASEWRAFYAAKPGQSAGQDQTDSGQDQTGISPEDSEKAEDQTDSGQDQTDSGQYRSDSDTRTQRNTQSARAGGQVEDGAAEADAPSLDEVLTRAAMSGVSAETAREFFWHYEAQGWKTSGANQAPVTNWVAKLMQWNGRRHSFDRADKPSDPSAPKRMRDLTADLAAGGRPPVHAHGAR